MGCNLTRIKKHIDWNASQCYNITASEYLDIIFGKTKQDKTLSNKNNILDRGGQRVDFRHPCRLLLGWVGGWRKKISYYQQRKSVITRWVFPISSSIAYYLRHENTYFFLNLFVFEVSNSVPLQKWALFSGWEQLLHLFFSWFLCFWQLKY